MHDGDKLVRLLTDARLAGFRLALGEGSTLLITRDGEQRVAIPATDPPFRLDTDTPLDGLDGVRAFLGLSQR